MSPQQWPNRRMGVRIERPVVTRILARFSKGPELIQIMVGPRQVGKTTAARAVERAWTGAVRYAAADLPLPPGPEWVENQWQMARRDLGSGPSLLILDEVQKVRGWSEVVKACWDEDRAAGRQVRVLLLGSSALLLARGASESLAGRFFLHRCPHWSWPECREAFGWDLDRWIFFGGYPAAAALVDDEASWRSYILDSLIETVIARDVLALLFTGLDRYSAGEARSRGSSPMLVAWSNALVSALRLRSFEETRSAHDAWGRLVENAVGAHLLNHLQGLPYEVTYWRHRSDEVDFVVRSPRGVWAIEVKSGRSGKATGAAAFLRAHPTARLLLVGSGGLALEEFFLLDPKDLLA